MYQDFFATSLSPIMFEKNLQYQIVMRKEITPLRSADNRSIRQKKNNASGMGRSRCFSKKIALLFFTLFL